MRQQPYSQAFYEARNSGSRKSANVIVPMVLEMVTVQSVCDVGCGVGTWLRCWQEHGVDDVLGMDGDYIANNQLMIPAASFRRTNLCDPFSSDRTYDLAMSVEVAEHLPEVRADEFVDNLTSLAPLVLFSAAIPGQGGKNHFNERWQSYWIKKFELHGFDVFDVLRSRIWDNADVEYWYRQNILMFCRRDSLANFPGLTTAAQTLIMSIAHPELVQQLSNKRSGVKESIVSLKDAIARSSLKRIKKIGGSAFL